MGDGTVEFCKAEIEELELALDGIFLQAQRLY